MTLALKWTGQTPGVSVAELNLKLVWDVVSRIDSGRMGYAYVVDSGGTLIAHPDISLVLQKTDLSNLPQVRAALAALRGRDGEPFEAGIGMDPRGDMVLAASAPIALLGWSVLVEQPAAEAFAPLCRSLAGTLVILIVGLCMAVAASFLLARRIARPIQALHAGATRIGAGALDHRIEVRTGDELELLADEFNRMAARLPESYATLEQNVEARTRQLSEALKQLKDQLISLSDDVHRISRQLHPAILDDLGLEDALRSECDRFAERQHIQVRFHCRDLPDTGPGERARDRGSDGSSPRNAQGPVDHREPFGPR